MTHTSQDFAAFLESLKVKKEPLEIVEGRRFDLPYGDIPKPDIYSGGSEAVSYVRYIELRMVRAESNAKPETLAEDVKAYMRAGMGISEKCADNSCPCPLDLEGTCYALEFRKLCEPGDK